jgi:hypothetical protein
VPELSTSAAACAPTSSPRWLLTVSSEAMTEFEAAVHSAAGTSSKAWL